MNIAIIPARGGSKRIPHKNIKIFRGQPIISRAIETAKRSKIFSEIIVSTDDQKISEIASKSGAIVPFLRNTSLADDYTPTLPVIQDVIERYIKHKNINPNICCIYPTTPLMKEEYLAEGRRKLESHKDSFVFSVTEYQYPIQRALVQTPFTTMKLREPHYAETRSQDLEQTYHDAGQFYWATMKTWLTSSNIIGQNSVGVVIPRILAQDIDTAEDWQLSEFLFDYLNKKDN